jgi:transglutaminase-like putative cysteine protease
MRVRASCELRFESRAETPIVLMLRARRDAAQRVFHDALGVAPSLPTTALRDMLGNRCDVLVAPPGELVVHSQIVAEVSPYVAARSDAPRTPFPKLFAEALHFTLPSRYCPADKLRTLAQEVTRGCAPGYAEVQAIRDCTPGSRPTSAAGGTRSTRARPSCVADASFLLMAGTQRMSRS